MTKMRTLMYTLRFTPLNEDIRELVACVARHHAKNDRGLRARLLLLLDAGRPLDEIIETTGVSAPEIRTLVRWREQAGVRMALLNPAGVIWEDAWVPMSI